jgi:hypothetical protein
MGWIFDAVYCHRVAWLQLGSSPGRTPCDGWVGIIILCDGVVDYSLVYLYPASTKKHMHFCTSTANRWVSRSRHVKLDLEYPLECCDRWVAIDGVVGYSLAACDGWVAILILLL